ncbi:Phosphatidylinositol 4-kinase gamma 7 [Diplonema papillatum]|nr:Phosphatidylinositol 4-kinase gamma 7 [Diplonema papillatum]|eukprot:gene13051-20129_t
MLANATFFAEDGWHNLGNDLPGTPLLKALTVPSLPSNASSSSLLMSEHSRKSESCGDLTLYHPNKHGCVPLSSNACVARMPYNLLTPDSCLDDDYMSSTVPTPEMKHGLPSTGGNCGLLISPTKAVVQQQGGSWASDHLEAQSSLGFGSEGSSFDEDAAFSLLSVPSGGGGGMRRNGHSQSMENIVDLVFNANAAAKERITPELSVEGTGGTYFVKKSDGKKVGVFKPSDEEVSTEHNPRGFEKESFKECIPKGESWKREIAAYRLDHGHFAGVPETFQMVLPAELFRKEGARDSDCIYDKVGSFQKYVAFDAEAWDVLPARLPTEAIQRIAILDIRLCNADRHGGNMLVIKPSLLNNHTADIVPIDHGCCIPVDLTELEFEWMCWTQSKLPLDDECKRYIEALNPEDDARILVTELGIDQRCADNVQAATMLLKKAARQNLTVYDIGCLMRRPRVDTPSQLEILLSECLQPLDLGGNIDFSIIDPLMDNIIESAVRSKAETGSVC